MSATDVNAIKAGDYVLVANIWDEITSKPGEPFDFVRHRKGDKVKLDVEQARRLVTAGAVVKPGDYEKSQKGEVPGSGPSTAPDGSPGGADGDEGDQGTGKEPTVEEILVGVGDDLEKARAALAAEQEARGDKARKTLVGPLEAVIAKAESGS